MRTHASDRRPCGSRAVPLCAGVSYPNFAIRGTQVAGVLWESPTCLVAVAFGQNRTRACLTAGQSANAAMRQPGSIEVTCGTIFTRHTRPLTVELVVVVVVFVAGTSYCVFVSCLFLKVCNIDAQRKASQTRRQPKPRLNMSVVLLARASFGGGC